MRCRTIGKARKERLSQELIDRLAATGFLRETPDQTDSYERGLIAPSRVARLASHGVRSKGLEHETMHRLIMTSQAYRQSSKVESQETLAADPDNALLSRMPLRRIPI